MLSISSIPVTGTVRKDQPTDREEPTGAKRRKTETAGVKEEQPDPAAPLQLRFQSGKTFQLLGCLSANRDLRDYLMEWLPEKESIQLMQTNHFHHHGVTKSYYSKMKPPLQHQSGPTILQHPTTGNPRAKWVLLEKTIQSTPFLNVNGGVNASRHTATVKPYRADPAEHGFRPASAPRWKVESIEQKPGSRSSNTYTARLIPIGPEADHPAYLYRNPANRLERYIPTDQAGLDYLELFDIRHPLTRNIRDRFGITVAQTEKSIREKRRSIALALASGKLSLNQSEAIKNELYAEHVECGRIDLEVAARLADNPRNLFYSLTLLPLCRKGIIQLTDVAGMSDHGILLLHDPRLVNLICDGVISKEQLKSLTSEQLESISILYRPLLSGQVSSREALALTQDQIAGVRKTGLMEQLANGRITLKTALWLAERGGKTTLESGAHFDYSVGRHASSSSCSSSSSSSSSLTSSFSSLGISTTARKCERMPFSDVAMLFSRWPTHEIREAAFDSNHFLSFNWLIVLQRVTSQLPAFQSSDIPELQVVLSDSPLFTVMPPIPGLQSMLAASRPSLSEEPGVPLSDLAVLFSRMPSKILREAILDYEHERNTPWVTQFGKVLPLMPLEKIIEFLDLNREDGQELTTVFREFDDFLTFRRDQEIAQAYNQIVIQLAEHLPAEDYLKLASLFLKNVLAWMMEMAFSARCARVIDQCSEIWCLVQSRCEMTGQSPDPYSDIAMAALLDRGAWGDPWDSNSDFNADLRALTAFGRFIVNMEMLEDERFLQVWTGDFFSQEFDFDTQYKDVRRQLGPRGFAGFHALFSPFRQFVTGDRGYRFTSMAIAKAWRGPLN